ncbi:MAG: hypothetical protein KF736_11870 [Acidobacteria bacterium]|nr:hypothetical protein [Acidobacteriota bacterium]MCW5948770.1 hypothetical protein [Pyrinomonadaceae bacterium]
MRSVSKWNRLPILAAAAALAFAVTAYAGLSGSEDGADTPPYTSFSITGPSGGDVRAVAIDPRDKNKMYISTLDGHIHASVDGGRSWRLLVNFEQPQLIIDDLFVDVQDSKIIFASGHRHKEPGGFFRSTDGGVTWKASSDLKKESIHALTQSTVDPNLMLAGAVSGVWISRNRGADWVKIDSPTNPVNIDSLAIDPRGTTTFYAGTWWRAYKTTDAGRTWRLIKDGMIDDSDVFAVTIDRSNPDHVIASACSGIYESYNAGERWSKIQGIPSQSRRTRDIMQNPANSSTIYAATTEGFWMTTNGGKSWSLTTQRSIEINSIAAHPDDPNRIFIGTNNYGVMVSEDGGRSFTQTNINFSSRFTYSVTADNSQPNRLYAATRNTATGGGFFFVSSDGGNSWQQSRGFDVTRVAPFAILQDRQNPNTIYIGSNIGLLRSTDRGVSFAPVPPGKVAVAAPPRAPARTPVKKGTPATKAATKPAAAASAAAKPAPTAKFVATINEKIKVLAHTEDGKNGLIAGTDKGLFRTYDLAKGWERLNLGAGINDNIFAVHVSPARPDTIWVGTAVSGVIVSRDRGATWEKTSGAPENAPVSSIASDPRRPDYIYVGTSQTFYLSRDNGATWLRRGGNLPLGNYTSIMIDPVNTDEIVVSNALESDGGIFITTDAGNKWRRVDGKELQLPSRRVWSLTADPQNPNRIFAGTHSSGIYRIDLRPTSAASNSEGDRPRVAN